MSELLKNPELEAGTQLSSQEKKLLKTDRKRKNFVEKAVNDVNAKYPKNPLLDWHRQQAKNLETIQEKQQKAREEKIDAKRRNDPFYGKSEYEADQIRGEIEWLFSKNRKINLSQLNIPDNLLEESLKNNKSDSVIHIEGNLTDSQCQILVKSRRLLLLEDIQLSDKQATILSVSQTNVLGIKPKNPTNKQIETLSKFKNTLVLTLDNPTAEQLRYLSKREYTSLSLWKIDPYHISVLKEANFQWKLHYEIPSINDEEATLLANLNVPVILNIKTISSKQIEILSKAKSNIGLFKLENFTSDNAYFNKELLLKEPFVIKKSLSEKIKKEIDQ